MHIWGDEGVDWAAINAVAEEIPHHMRRWGRITVHGKEKYGTVRLEFLYYGFSLNQFFFPGYMYYGNSRIQKVFHKIDMSATAQWIYTNLINPWYTKYQMWITKRAIKKAVKKYPHIRKEILSDILWTLDLNEGDI